MDNSLTSQDHILDTAFSRQKKRTKNPKPLGWKMNLRWQTWTKTSLRYRYSTELQKHNKIFVMHHLTWMIIDHKVLKRAKCTQKLDRSSQANKRETFTKWRNKPIIELLHWKNQIEHHCISYWSINKTESHNPSKFTDVHFSFHSNHHQQRAPCKSFNYQGYNLHRKFRCFTSDLHRIIETGFNHTSWLWDPKEIILQICGNFVLTWEEWECMPLRTL